MRVRMAMTTVASRTSPSKLLALSEPAKKKAAKPRKYEVVQRTSRNGNGEESWFGI